MRQTTADRSFVFLARGKINKKLLSHCTAHTQEYQILISNGNRTHPRCSINTVNNALFKSFKLLLWLLILVLKADKKCMNSIASKDS